MNSKHLTRIFALCVACVSSAVWATETTIPDDITLNGTTFFSVASGDTKIYTGKITGSGCAVIDAGDPSVGRGGMVVFQNDANDYTGGTIVSNATFRIDSTGAVGSGAVTVALPREKVSGTSTTRSILEVNCALVTNKIVLLRMGDNSPNEVNFRLNVKTLLTDLETKSDLWFTSTATSDMGVSELSCDLNMPGKTIGLFSQYDFDLTGKITCNTLKPQGTTSEEKLFKNSVNLRTMSNEVTQVEFAYGNLALFATNALPGTRIRSISALGGAYQNRARLHLNGFPQTVSALRSINPNGYSIANRATKSNSILTPDDKPTVLTITGAAASSEDDTQIGLWGPLSLVIDVDTATYSAFRQGFINRDVMTTGDVTVRRGKMYVGGYGNFPNVPRLSVESEGELTIASTNEDRVIFASVTNLSLYGTLTVTAPRAFNYANFKKIVIGPEADITFPASVTSLMTDELYLDDGEGNLTRVYGSRAVPQLKGVRITAAIPEAATSATWTGNGANTSVETADNWSTTPALPAMDDFSLEATFAGGEEASLTRELDLRSLTYTGAGDFRLVGDEKLGLVSAATVSTENATFTVETAAELQGAAAQAFSVATNATLSFEGGIEQFATTGTNTKTGGGTLAFAGEAKLTRPLSVNEGTLRLSGTNTFAELVSVRSDLSNTILVLSNAVVKGGVDVYSDTYGYSSGEAKKILFLEGLTNELAGALRQWVGYMALCGDGGSTFILSGGGNGYNRRFYFVRKNGTEGLFKTIICGTPFEVLSDSGVSTFCSVENTEIVFACPTNGYKATRNVISLDGGTLSFACDNAVTNCSIWNYGAGSGTVDMNRTKQRFLKFANDTDYHMQSTTDAKNSHITGEYGSEFGVSSGRTAHHYEGAVSLVKWGAADTTLIYSNNTASSFGDVKVESGTMRFGDKGFWPNGTNVTVGADGVLSIAQSATFGKFVKISLAEGGKMQLDAGVRQRAAGLTLGTEVCQPGTYGSSQSSATFKRDDYFTGTGVVTIRGGMMLIVR